MIRSYGAKYRCDFPDPDVVVQELNIGDIATIKEIDTEYNYILTKELRYWTKISGLAQIASAMVSVAAENAEWLTIDEEDNWLADEYVRCSNCNRGVHIHYAGSWCTFCGKTMKNPMR